MQLGLESTGPKLCAQYGAPFKEEDWTDDGVETCLDTVPHANRPELDHVLPSSRYISSVPTSTDSPEGMCTGPSSESCVSDVVPHSCNVFHSDSSTSVTTEKHCVSANMLGCFAEERTFPINGNDKNKELDNPIDSGNTSTTQKLDILNSRNAEELNILLHSGNANATPDFHASDIYRDLADLGNLGIVEDGFKLSNGHGSLYTMDEIFELVILTDH